VRRAVWRAVWWDVAEAAWMAGLRAVERAGRWGE